MPRDKAFPAHACVTDLRVRYAETDQMGFVYYANYPIWFEVGRASFMRDRGVPYGEWESAGYILPVSTVNYRLFSPAHYDDRIRVVTWIEKIRSRSVQFRYKILREGKLLAEGETVHICINPDRRPISIPDHYRRAIAPRER